MTNHSASAAGKLLCLMLLCFGFSTHQATAQNLVQTPITKDVNYAIGGYYECLPLDYAKSDTKKYPLLIFIHGIGELGDGSPTQLPRILKHGVTKLINQKLFPNSFTVNGETSSFIVVSPQFRENYRDAAAVSSLIDYCVAKYRVDESRIYLTGLSMGGGISWIYAGKSEANANRLAALLVIAGNTNASSGGIANIASANLPVWATHNSDDPVVSTSNTINWINGLNAYTPAIKPKALMNIFNSTSHDAWSRTYDLNFKPNGLNVFEWMLSHKRGGTTAPANQEPVANAGADQAITLPDDLVVLDGSASDADGTIAQYIWTKQSGPTQGDITYPGNSVTTATGLVKGTYVFRLTAKDNDGATATDDMKVIVNDVANQPPVANAGNDITLTLPLDSTAVLGDGSDDDGTIASYLWTKVSGPGSGAIDNENAPQTWLAGLAQGAYVYRLTVTDNDGATATDDVNVIVNAAKPAVVKAGTDTLIYKNQTRPDTAFLNGLASVGGTSYVWRKISGPGKTLIEDSTALTTTAIGLEEGTHVFGLTIDGTASDNVTVVVRDWQKKNVSPCRPGGGKSFIVPETSPGQYNMQYINRDKLLGQQVMGGDTLYFKGGAKRAFEIGDFGGGEGCPVYVMPKDEALVITDGYFRVGIRDSNVVQHVVLDGTVLRSKGIPYGFFIDNRNVPNSENNYAGLVATWVSNFTVKGYHSINTGIMQIKIDAKEEAFGRYDKFIQKRIRIQDNFINGSSAEGMYIGHTASNGGQMNNPYGPPPRMDSVEISDNIITNCNWDGIQLANARTAAVIRHNFIYKTGLDNQPSQRAGIIMGGNTTGIIDSNIVINSKGNGIQVFGYGAVKVQSNIVDSIFGGSGDQDGIYQSHIAVVPETFNIPLGVTNFGNLISRVERKDIKVANNSGNMLPGHTYSNTFIDPTETNADELITANASDAVDNNQVIASFPFHVNELGTKKGTPFISMTQGADTETFTTVKDVVDWLFGRLKGNTASNEPPVANAGTDKTITLPMDSVTLAGSGADNDGSIVIYQWKQVAGPANSAIKTATNNNTVVTNLSEGVYKFALAVTDNGKATDADTVKITVNAAIAVENIAPEVFAGKAMRITLPTDSVVLKGTATDEDGTITAIKWTKISGPVAYGFANENTLQTTVNSLVKGVYRFELSATDNIGAITRDTVKVTVAADAVIPANVIPVATAGNDQSIQLPLNKVTLAGAGTDADGTIESYHWRKISGPAKANIKNANAAATQVIGLTKGTYRFELMVTDNIGATKTDTVQVTVLDKANRRPLANAGADQTIQLPENSIILNGKGADEDGSIESYKWTKISGPSLPDFTGAASAQVKLRNLKAGIYLFELKVADNDGASAADTIQLTVKAAAAVQNKVPHAYAGYDLTVQLPVNNAILSGTGLDEDGVIKNYQWAQLSGPATAALLTPKEAQASAGSLAAGIYKFQLKVTDNAGAINADTVLVTVKAALPPTPNKAPVVSAGKDLILTLPVIKTTVTGVAVDADGTIASYQWTKISGSAQYTIVTPQSAQTEINNLAKGVYKFELKVTDNKGAISKDTVMITVQTAATRPMFVMNAGNDKVITLPTDSIALKGVVDDPYQTVRSFTWTKVNGPVGGSFSTATAAETKVTKLVEGVYMFACTAKDENGNTLSDTVQVTVKILPKSTATVFPNPSNGNVIIRIDANTRATNTALTVYDLGGKAVYKETFMRNQGQMQKALNLSKLAPGIYTVEIVVDINNRTSTKLVKQ